MGEEKDAAAGEFAERVRALKDRSGRSFEALARRLDVSASSLYRYCSGATVPEEFTPVEQLARLCGASREERVELHRLWILADAARRPTGGAVSGGAVPEEHRGARREVSVSVPVPEGEPVIDGAQDGPVPEAAAAPPAVPDPEPDSPPVPPVSPERPVRAVRRGRLRWAALLVALVATVAATAVVLSRSDGADRKGAAGGKRPAASPRTAEAPFTWTANSQSWKLDCGHTYLVDRAPGRVPQPPVVQDAAVWARSTAAVHGGETQVRITLQGRSPQKAVVLEALHVRVTGRARPLPWNAFRMDNGCGGAVTPRYVDVDLDGPRPAARPVKGYDGIANKPIEAVSFPYAVTSTAPEVLLVTARATTCDCRWYLELEWSSEGRSGTVRIADGDGGPFRTSGVKGRPLFSYDGPGRRWVQE
ncbi:helix-turn-helix domain-containing protein [Streptomyces sp. NPDC050504]|uniref:helix-turn-helix domain-containing protein n=1 Tax=Streptomyces sp. NPDC050504 TaxID=3365618 RepID=UPI0037B327B3